MFAQSVSHPTTRIAHLEQELLFSKLDTQLKTREAILTTIVQVTSKKIGSQWEHEDELCKLDNLLESGKITDGQKGKLVQLLCLSALDIEKKLKPLTKIETLIVKFDSAIQKAVKFLEERTQMIHIDLYQRMLAYMQQLMQLREKYRKILNKVRYNIKTLTERRENRIKLQAKLEAEFEETESECEDL